MLETLTEQSCKTESDYLQYCTVGEDGFNLIDVRFDFPLCVLIHVTYSDVDARSMYHLLFSCLSRICQEMVVSADAQVAPSIAVTVNTRYQPKPYTLPALLI
jgi:hypothetical protein